MKQTQTILDDIILCTKKELEKKKKKVPLELLVRKGNNKGIRDFKKALRLSRHGGIARGKPSLIAEIKQKSPSQGVIRKAFDVEKIARAYEKAGVDAISVLTEPNYFGGSLEYLSVAKNNTSVPIFRKDFIFDPYQIYEARVCGADAFLLIAAILSKKELLLLMGIGEALGMHCMIEVHTKEEMELALNVDAQIIGINNRNLRTFREDLSTFGKLAPMVPKNKILVAESGIKTVQDVMQVYTAGASAILVGTALMQSENIKEKVKELKGSSGAVRGSFASLRMTSAARKENQ